MPPTAAIVFGAVCAVFVLALGFALYHLVTAPDHPDSCNHTYTIYATEPTMCSACSICGKEHPLSGTYPAQKPTENSSKME